MVLLGDAEDVLDLRSLFRVWVINLFRIQLFHFFSRDEAALVTEPLLGQILTAIIAHLLFVASLELLPPVLSDFLDYIKALGLALGQLGIGTTLFLVYNFARCPLSIQIIVRGHFFGFTQGLQRLVQPSSSKFIVLMRVVSIRLGFCVITAQRVVHYDVTFGQIFEG